MFGMRESTSRRIVGRVSVLHLTSMAVAIGLMAVTAFSYVQPLTVQFTAPGGWYSTIVIHRGALLTRFSFSGIRNFTSGDLRRTDTYNSFYKRIITQIDLPQYDFVCLGFRLALEQRTDLPIHMGYLLPVIPTPGPWHVTRRVRAPLGLPLALVGLLFLVVIWRRAYRTRRCARLGLCLTCEYDLRGSFGRRCPECGAPRPDQLCDSAPR